MAVFSAAMALLSTFGAQTAAQPQPATSPSYWITQDDYPEAVRRKGQQGDTAFRVDVDTQGRVAGCTITASSGSALLDETTCTLITRRARFKPPPATRRGRWSSDAGRACSTGGQISRGFPLPCQSGLVRLGVAA